MYRVTDIDRFNFIASLIQASDELVLYEDELHDNGVCRLSLKMVWSQ